MQIKTAFDCQKAVDKLFDFDMSESELISFYQNEIKEVFGQHNIKSDLKFADLVNDVFKQSSASASGLTKIQTSDEVTKEATEAIEKHFAGQDLANFDQLLNNLFAIRKRYLIDSCPVPSDSLEIFSLLTKSVSKHAQENKSVGSAMIKAFNEKQKEVNQRINQDGHNLMDFTCNCIQNKMWENEVYKTVMVTLEKIQKNEFQFKDESHMNNVIERMVLLTKISASYSLKNTAIFTTNFFEAAYGNFVINSNAKDQRRFSLHYSKQVFAHLLETTEKKVIMTRVPQFSLAALDGLKIETFSLIEFISARCEKECAFDFKNEKTLVENQLLAFEFFLAASIKEFGIPHIQETLPVLIEHFDTIYSLDISYIRGIEALKNLSERSSMISLKKSEAKLETERVVMTYINKFIVAHRPEYKQPDFAIAFDKFLDEQYDSDEQFRSFYHHIKVYNAMATYAEYKIDFEIALRQFPASLCASFEAWKTENKHFFVPFEGYVKEGKVSAKVITSYFKMIGGVGERLHVKQIDQDYDKHKIITFTGDMGKINQIEGETQSETKTKPRKVPFIDAKTKQLLRQSKAVDANKKPEVSVGGVPVKHEQVQVTTQQINEEPENENLLPDELNKIRKGPQLIPGENQKLEEENPEKMSANKSDELPEQPKKIIQATEEPSDNEHKNPLLGKIEHQIKQLVTPVINTHAAKEQKTDNDVNELEFDLFGETQKPKEIGEAVEPKSQNKDRQFDAITKKFDVKKYADLKKAQKLIEFMIKGCSVSIIPRPATQEEKEQNLSEIFIKHPSSKISSDEFAKLVEECQKKELQNETPKETDEQVLPAKTGNQEKPKETADEVNPNSKVFQTGNTKQYSVKTHIIDDCSQSIQVVNHFGSDNSNKDENIYIKIVDKTNYKIEEEEYNSIVNDCENPKFFNSNKHTINENCGRSQETTSYPRKLPEGVKQDVYYKIEDGKEKELLPEEFTKEVNDCPQRLIANMHAKITGQLTKERTEVKQDQVKISTDKFEQLDAKIGKGLSHQVQQKIDRSKFLELKNAKKVIEYTFKSCSVSIIPRPATEEELKSGEKEVYVFIDKNSKNSINKEKFEELSNECASKNMLTTVHQTMEVNPLQAKINQKFMNIKEIDESTLNQKSKPYTITTYTYDDCSLSTSRLSTYSSDPNQEDVNVYQLKNGENIEKIEKEKFDEIEYDCENPKSIPTEIHTLFADCGESTRTVTYQRKLPDGVKLFTYFVETKTEKRETDEEGFKKAKEQCSGNYIGFNFYNAKANKIQVLNNQSIKEMATKGLTVKLNGEEDDQSHFSKNKDTIEKAIVKKFNVIQPNENMKHEDDVSEFDLFGDENKSKNIESTLDVNVKTIQPTIEQNENELKPQKVTEEQVMPMHNVPKELPVEKQTTSEDLPKMNLEQKKDIINILKGDVSNIAIDKLRQTPELIEYIKLNPIIVSEDDNNVRTQYVFLQLGPDGTPCSNQFMK